MMPGETELLMAVGRVVAAFDYLVGGSLAHCLFEAIALIS